MELLVELNGTRTKVTRADLFRLAAEGAITPNTKLWYDGRELLCSRVQGLTFATNSNTPAILQFDYPPKPEAFEPTTDQPRVTRPVPSPSGNSFVQNRSSFSPQGSPANPQNSDSSTTTSAKGSTGRIHTNYLDYEILGNTLPVVLCYLSSNQQIRSSAGGRTWMKGAITTENKAEGGVMKSLGRMLSGETIFMSYYRADEPSEIAFATSFPGTIVARELQQKESIIAQKGSFLAATSDVSLETFFQKKIGTGFFGGEGFIMQKITGPGVVFLELDGYCHEYDLKTGEKLTCDTGVVAMMDATCTIDAVMVQGLKNMFFGGEGVFDTVVTGPGKVMVQSMTISTLAKLLAPFFPKS